ncbi:hypothetical protein J5N97_030002 [Dioscorea zingiberensis]|uniref:Auxin-responsive protein SAUR32 n=1 Tax=Dioscorea zingiberensis TaxID=325984 RepID=A0A9D5BWX7_9LILI|nr:hypothetical protein J5N97_030002 [Dioscorea zingiberensis]
MTCCSSLSNFTTSPMGVGDHHHFHHMGFHLLHLANNKKSASEAALAAERAPPKGCTVVRVGSAGEEQQRFVVPVEYLNHPLFGRLLKEAEEEYGFQHMGAISIPCQLHEFHHVRRIIVAPERLQHTDDIPSLRLLLHRRSHRALTSFDGKTTPTRSRKKTSLWRSWWNPLRCCSPHREVEDH